MPFPPPLDSYAHASGAPLLQVLRDRISAEPFNLVATLLFFCAIVHTFLAPFFTRLSHRLDQQHREQLKARGEDRRHPEAPEEVSFLAELFHFFGEVEAIFGIWILPLLLGVLIFHDWSTAVHYIESRDFTEPLFVVVVMSIAASRPILKLAEGVMALAASLGKGSPMAWWFSILSIGPLLGSFITEPAAMTLSALLLASKFYDARPGRRFAYATIGLLFVNVSIGGTLTHFAAPPVLMVAGEWKWTIGTMLSNFGWKAVLAILGSNLLYLLVFRREFRSIQLQSDGDAIPAFENRNNPIPVTVTLAHLAFLVWTVVNSHNPVFFIGGFLFFLAFAQATEHHQNEIRLRPALLVGFFLAGLVVHGGLQAWWIEPVLSRLSAGPLFIGSTVLTAFNDNAAITYLGTFVPAFTDIMKYALVAGAVTGGGLTVIANAPNPAGNSILCKYFPDGISPVGLFLGALPPTLIAAAFFAGSLLF